MAYVPRSVTRAKQARARQRQDALTAFHGIAVWLIPAAIAVGTIYAVYVTLVAPMLAQLSNVLGH